MIKAKGWLRSAADVTLPEYRFEGSQWTIGGFLPILSRKAGEGVTLEVDYRADGEVRFHIKGMRSKKRIGFLVLDSSVEYRSKEVAA